MRFAELLTSHDLMHHELRVTEIHERKEWLGSLCAGQSVLHVGCCDVPVFAPDTNLHIFLARFTDRLDGLDISEDGIAVLERHVPGRYFTSTSDVNREYDLILVPEVLEHTRNPEGFLAALFQLKARRLLFTAPSYEWYREARLAGGVFHESVHGDHKAFYSPYTLLNTLRPFVDEERDDLEIFLIGGIGSIGLLIDTHRPVEAWAPEAVREDSTVEGSLRDCLALDASGATGEAIARAKAAFERFGDLRLAEHEIELRLKVGQSLEALRRGVEVMRSFPDAPNLLSLCAEAMERLGDPTQAAELRELARQKASGKFR